MTNDDPRLTAYALNELEVHDRDEVEAFLAGDETARRIVEETRRTVAMLTQGLHAASAPALTEIQRQSITAAANPAIGRPSLSYEHVRRPYRRAWAKWALATAACAALAAGGISALHYRQTTINRNLAFNGPVTTATSQTPQTKATIAALTERSKERIRKHQLKQALGILTQILELDPSDQYARQTYPLIYDEFQRNPNKYTETREREITNSLNARDNLKVTSQPGDLLFDWQGINPATKPAGGHTPAPFANSGGTNGAVPVLTGRDSVGFTSNPTTGVPGSIGATGAGVASGGNGGGGGGGGGGRGGETAFAGIKRDNIYSKNNSDPNAPKFAGDSVLLPGNISWDETIAGSPAKGDISALVAHYRLRGADGIHLLDGGTVKYSQAEFEEAARAGTLPQNVIAAIREQYRGTATAPNESYAAIHDNPFLPVANDPLSTFSIDVDTASYSNIRRFLNDGHFPPPDAVRIEEMLNYFPYTYETPKSDSKVPFATTIEIAACPWNMSHRLARVAIKGREIAHDKRPVSNLVFLIDVSGSMNEPAKLPLVKEGLKLMVNELSENDRISIVVYAGNAGLVLNSTTADPKNKPAILNAIDNLSAGGSTNGGQGIELAYKLATDNFIKGGTNRVLLATDGDWNVGITDQSSLTQLIQDKAKSGVFLSVLGYGFGNLKDATMEKLADKGNGHYAYIDNLKESKKVLVEEMSSTLVTIAKDVKIQVEFNPSKVESYCLIGYEKRLLRKEDFNNDKVDAGEIGAGHAVTALYEIAPLVLSKNSQVSLGSTVVQGAEVDPLIYANNPRARAGSKIVLTKADESEELTVDKDGNITHKIFGKIKVEGASTNEIAWILTNRAKEMNIIFDRKVSIVDGVKKATSGDLMTVKIRYKQPDGEQSAKLEFPAVDKGLTYSKASEDFKFSAAVAQFGMILRNSPHKGTASLDGVLELAAEGKGKDEKGYRAEFLEMVTRAKALSK